MQMDGYTTFSMRCFRTGVICKRLLPKDGLREVVVCIHAYLLLISTIVIVRNTLINVFRVSNRFRLKSGNLPDSVVDIAL